MDANTVTFRSGVVKPIVCLKSGWQLIKDQYWVALGITFVGILLGSFAPMGVLLGPMMCGIYYSFFAKSKGESLDFKMLFKGFEYFIPSLVASLIQIVPMMVLLMPMNLYLVFSMQKNEWMLQSDDPVLAQQWLWELFSSFLPWFAGTLLLVFALSILMMFAYPLIVDKKLSGWEAIKTSARAAFSNLGGLIGLFLLNFLIGFVAALCCYVGVIFVMPITLAASFMAYQQVFKLEKSL